MTSVVVPLSEETATDRWKRRRAILDVLNPGGTITYKHLDFAVGMAVHHRWNVRPATHEFTRANHATQTISTPPIHGDKELACFFHEAGHLADVDNKRHIGVSFKADGILWRESLDAEFIAWRLSMKFIGHLWSCAMTNEMERCLRTYQPNHVRSYNDLMVLEAIVAEGVQLARHVVRILPANTLRNRGAR